MEAFTEWLRSRGKTVIHYRLNYPDNTQKLATNIANLVRVHNIQKFEYRLDQQLQLPADDLSIETEVFNTEHFLTGRDELAAFFADNKSLLMESLYRHMRRQHDVLMDGDKPAGG